MKPDYSTQFPRRPGWWLTDLLSTASSRTLKLTFVAVVVTWLPLAILSAVRGVATLLSFLTDYPTQSRFLIILPVLMLAEPQLHGRLTLVAEQFERGLVPLHQQAEFQSEWTSSERLRDSMLIRVLMVILSYASAAFLGQYLSPSGSEFVSWWTGGPGFRTFSLAGTWAFFVSYPILVYFVYLWLFRQWIWARFLSFTTRLDLRLIAAHPDHLGGLGFLEASLLGQLPFSFCLGVGLAGAVANRVFHEGAKIIDFRLLIPVLIGTVLLICVAPHLCFTRTLMQMRRRGMLRYGAFARAVGEQFERKWLHQEAVLNEDVLKVPDFTTTSNLFNLVGNVDNIRVIPVGLVDLYAMVVVAMIPAVPVVVFSIPFNTLIQAMVKFLF